MMMMERNRKYSLQNRIFVVMTSLPLIITLLGRIQKNTNSSAFNQADSIEMEYNEDFTDDLIEIEDNYEITEHGYNETVNMKDMYQESKDGSVIEGNDITYGDLLEVTTADIILNDDDSYEYLNYMPNLEKLYITDKSNTNCLRNIDGSRFQKRITVDIYLEYSDGVIDEKRYGFLKDIPYIDQLILGAEKQYMNIDYDFLQDLKNVHNLTISVDSRFNFRYKDLTYLDSLKIIGRPYDIAMNFPNELIDYLINNGVDVQIDNMEAVREANNRAKDIYMKLGITSNMTDKEKIDQIVRYIVESFEYNPEIEQASENNEQVDEEEIRKQFYSMGSLSGALKSDTQVCGNYTSMTYLLCREAGIDCYNVIENDHSYNIINIDGEYYRVDTTSLDTEETDLQDLSYHEMDENKLETVIKK